MECALELISLASSRWLLGDPTKIAFLYLFIYVFYIIPDQVKGWQRKVTFPHNKDLDWMEYNPREKSFSFWGEESNPEATGQGVPVALILGDSPTSLFFRGRVQDDLRLDQVGLAAWRLFVCLKYIGQVGILWTSKRLSQNSINIHISSILWHPDKSSDPRHCPWT